MQNILKDQKIVSFCVRTLILSVTSPFLCFVVQYFREFSLCVNILIKIAHKKIYSCIISYVTYSAVLRRSEEIILSTTE